MKISNAPAQSPSFGAIKVNIHNPITTKIAEDFTRGSMNKYQLAAYLDSTVPEYLHLLENQVDKKGNEFKYYLLPEETETIANLANDAKNKVRSFNDGSQMNLLKSYLDSVINKAKELTPTNQIIYSKNHKIIDKLSKYMVLKYNVADPAQSSTAEAFSRFSIDKSELRRNLLDVIPDEADKLSMPFVDDDGQKYQLLLRKDVGLNLIKKLQDAKNADSSINGSIDHQLALQKLKIAYDRLRNYIQKSVVYKSRPAPQKQCEEVASARIELKNLRDSFITN